MRSLAVLGLCMLMPWGGCALPERPKRSLNARADSAYTLRVGCFNPLEKLSPFYKLSGFAGAIGYLVYEGALRYDGELNTKPTFITLKRDLEKGDLLLNLKPGVRFHNGAPVTIEDIASVFRCAMQPKHNSWARPFLTEVEEITVTGRHTLAIKLSRPLAEPTVAFFLGVIPKEELPCSNRGANAYNPPGTGPFKLAFWSPQKVVLERNPHYWQQPAQIEKVIFPTYANKREAWAALIRGEVDIVSDLTTDARRITEQVAHLRTTTLLLERFYLLLFDMSKSYLKSVKVRRALNVAIDRQAIIQRVLDNQAVLSTGVIITSSEKERLTPYPYSPQLALKLLEEEGYRLDPTTRTLMKNNKPLKLKAIGFKGDDESIKLFREVYNYLREIGIELEITAVPADTMMSSIWGHQADLYHLYSKAYRDPPMLFEAWGGKIQDSYFRYENAELNKLFTDFFAGNGITKTQLLSRFNRIIYDDPPGIFLYWKQARIPVHRRIRQADLSAGNFWGDITSWRIDPNWKEQPKNLQANQSSSSNSLVPQ